MAVVIPDVSLKPKRNTNVRRNKNEVKQEIHESQSANLNIHGSTSFFLYNISRSQ